MRFWAYSLKLVVVRSAGPGHEIALSRLSKKFSMRLRSGFSMDNSSVSSIGTPKVPEMCGQVSCLLK